MGKGEGLNVFLETGRDLGLIAPEIVALELGGHSGIHILYLAEVFLSASGCAKGRRGLGVVRVLEDDTMEEEDGPLGEIGDIAGSLGE